jgi:hypothetical protein
MPDAIIIEKAEIQQILRWIGEIENNVKAVKKDPEETEDVVERCRSILRTIEKMRGFIVVIRD